MVKHILAIQIPVVLYPLYLARVLKHHDDDLCHVVQLWSVVDEIQSLPPLLLGILLYNTNNDTQ